MIKAFTITNHLNETIYLDIRRPEDTGFLITSVSGLNPVKTEISEGEFINYDGTFIDSARLNSRNIVFSVLFYDPLRNDVETIRNKCYRYFPVKKDITVTVHNDHGSFIIRGKVESNELNILSQNEGAQISIICPDPYFESSADSTVLLDDVFKNFQFPVTFPTQFGIIKPYPETSILYNGDDDSGFIIQIDFFGNTSGIRINRIDGNEYISVDKNKMVGMFGYYFKRYDQLVINTKKGQKSATLRRDRIEYDFLKYINSSQQWLRLEKGENHFTFTADEGRSYMKVYLIYNERYNGV